MCYVLFWRNATLELQHPCLLWLYFKMQCVERMFHESDWNIAHKRNEVIPEKRFFWLSVSSQINKNLQLVQHNMFKWAWNRRLQVEEGRNIFDNIGIPSDTQFGNPHFFSEWKHKLITVVMHVFFSSANVPVYLLSFHSFLIIKLVLANSAMMFFIISVTSSELSFINQVCLSLFSRLCYT